jgi:hypothetical protein
MHVDVCGVERKNYGSDVVTKSEKRTVHNQSETRVSTFPGIRSTGGGKHGRLRARVGGHVTGVLLKGPRVTLGERRRKARVRTVWGRRGRARRGDWCGAKRVPDWSRETAEDISVVRDCWGPRLSIVASKRERGGAG